MRRVTPLLVGTLLGLKAMAASSAIAASLAIAAPVTTREAAQGETTGGAMRGAVRLAARGAYIEIAADPRAAELVLMEREFCATVRRHGMRDGFLRYMAEDGILFRPGPVVAHEVLPQRPRTPAWLLWAAGFADVAASGDLGYTTGPSEFRPGGEADTTVGYGSFVTVWERDRDGAWRIAIDCGTGHDLSADEAAVLATAMRAQSGGRVPAAEAAVEAPAPPTAHDSRPANATRDPRPVEALLALDRAIGRASVAAESGTSADRNCRYLRNGASPAIGSVALREAMPGAEAASAPGSESVPQAGGVSSAFDLGYVYGGYAMGPGVQEERGSYLRIWKRSEEQWAVVLEVLCPHPPAP
ncbi:MAG: nuclear transport factor 2 family protein [Candidatus Eisenbacteria bacterium]|nr:nuclear transport factor 2 family protein [Candidatus Eisenbacteria bacterium]